MHQPATLAFDPATLLRDSPVPGGVLFVGTAANDTYTGSAFGDTLAGAGGNDTLSGGAGNDEIHGNDGADILAGDAGNDILSGGQGNDRIDGGAGRDTVQLDAPLASLRITRTDAGLEVTALGDFAAGGTDILTGVERLVFGNAGLAFDVDGPAGQVYRLYRTAFDRAPDAAGMGFWLSNVDKGVTLDALARAFVTTREFQDLYGSAPSNSAFVTRMYQHVLDRDPDPDGLAFWRDALDSRRSTISEVLVAFTENPENHQIVAGLIANGIPYAL